MAPDCHPAERAGFEPAVHLLSVRSLSKRLPSATRPPLRSCKRGRSMSSVHTPVNRVAATAALVLLALFADPRPAAACSCMAPPGPAEAREQAAAVFEGRVVAIT